MKITGLETYVVFSKHRNARRNWLLVKVMTDEGIEGLGDASLHVYDDKVAGLMKEWFETYLVGKDPLDTEVHWTRLYLDDFARGIESLKGLRDRLQVLVTEHDRWQRLEDELNPIASNVSRSPEVLAQSWPFVSELVHEMLGGLQEEWATALLMLDARIQERLAAGDATRARPLFYQFHSRVGNRFRLVNDDLLKVVVELQKIGESLQLFLKRIL